MEFKKYQHIERLGTEETKGIEQGICYVFPKIDGTNASLWWDNGLQAGSRNRQLSLESDNAGFYSWALSQPMFERFFTAYPHLRLFGEWLVPHSLKTYQENAWREFYVFDVMDNGRYLSYLEYQDILDAYDISHIPPIISIENPTHSDLCEQLDKNTFLISEGKGVGEGVVIKNYDYKNPFGRSTWAKIVTSDFKARSKPSQTKSPKDANSVEIAIVDKFITSSLVEKEFAKISADGGWSSKHIPRLLNTVFYCLITEESWNFVKEFKNPTVNFKILLTLTNNKVKELMPHLF